MARNLTQREFEEKIQKVHGELYDFSEVIYTRNREKIMVKCHIHGPFTLTASHFMAGSGCPSCMYDRKRNTLEKFIKKAKIIHGGKYKYDNVNYLNNRTEVEIFCKTHGKFNQTPDGHINGKHGCPKCYTKNSKKFQSQFLAECQLVHGNKYDYSRTNYVNDRIKIEIMCKKHGSFFQRPNSHVFSGQGCPKCANRISVSEIKFLDLIGIPEENRQYIIPKTRYEVDGFDVSTNTIYEFLGDYWHGNPTKYLKTKTISKKSKTTFGELYKNTINRFNHINSMGYKIKYLWESDWSDEITMRELKEKIIEYNK
jgi:hypothetical protein